MPKAINLIGKKFGRVKVISLHKRENETRKYPLKEYLLECDCKERFIRRQNDLTAGLVYECPNCVFRRSEFYIGGKKFGRLLVQDEWRISEWGNGHKYREWLCVCECGTVLWIAADSIRKGHTVSCGCYVMKNNSRYANETLYPKKHRLCAHPAYQRWVALVHKCCNSKSQSYSLYGDKGYTVCQSWKNSAGDFIKWLESKEWDKKLTIEIKEGKKEFNPKNCLLIKSTDLVTKNRRYKILQKIGTEYKGTKKFLHEWCEELNLNFHLIRSRIQNGRSFEEAIDMKRNGESGQWIKRNDISDEEIKELYESGKTYKEIEDLLSFNPKYRIVQMGLVRRDPKKRSAIDRNNKIHEMVRDKKTFNEIVKEIGLKNRYNLKVKMQILGYKFKGMELIND